MTGRRALLTGTAASAIALALPSGHARAGMFANPLALIKAAAGVVNTLVGMISVALKVREAFASPAASQSFGQAIQVMDEQPLFYDRLTNLKMFAESQYKKMRIEEMSAEISAVVGTARDIILEIDGPNRGVEAGRYYTMLDTLIRKLHSSSSESGIFPIYSAAAVTCLALGQMAIDSGRSYPRSALRSAALRYQSRIESWADRSQPTNPLVLADSLQAEIEDLTKWISSRRDIRVAETVVRYEERQPGTGGSGQVASVNKWYRNETLVRYGGFSRSGDLIIETVVKPRVEDFAGRPPYRYDFTANVGYYYNATDPQVASRFPCLVTDDKYFSWNAPPRADWTVPAGENVGAVLKAKTECIKGVYKDQWERLKELQASQALYQETARSMNEAALRLKALQA